MAKLSDSEQSMPFPILIGDIGGTNARFAMLIDSYAEPKHFPVAQTADFETIDDAIQMSVLDKTSVQPRSAILAVAGPIRGDEINLTNCPWVVRPKEMIERLGFSDVLIVNDFEAQALAIGSLNEQDREQIGNGQGNFSASRVVLGPGTGLGVAGLVHAQHAWIPVPGEGGHVDMGPRTERDYQLFPHYETIEGRVSAEQLLCGRGIVNIYRAVCAADGREPVFTKPAEISGSALSAGDSDLAAVETISLFCTYLGRVAGDIALVFMAKGGVFLAGGISQKILPALKGPEFRRAFEDKAPHSALMRQIPSYVVTHPQAALAGLADYARAPQRFGLPTEGRRWRS
jgi:glucokinase